MPPRPALAALLAALPALACGEDTACERHLGGLCHQFWGHQTIAVGVADAAPIDVDGDGVDEVAIVDGHTLTIAWEDRRLVTRSALGGPQRLAVADLDGDGRDDLVLATSEPAGLLRLRSRGDGGFDEDEAVPLDDPAFALAAADLDGDGAAELLAASHRTLTIVGGASEATSALEVGRGPVDLDLADLDGDGDLDVVIVDLEDGALTSLLGDGAGGLTLAATLPIGPATDEVDLADLDGDGRVDAIVRARIFAAAWIAAGDGAGGFDLPVEVALEDALETRGLAAIGPNTSGLVTLLAPSTEGSGAWVVNHAAAPFGRLLHRGLDPGDLRQRAALRRRRLRRAAASGGRDPADRPADDPGRRRRHEPPRGRRLRRRRSPRPRGDRPRLLAQDRPGDRRRRALADLALGA
ncbi:MAG: VCBS repeat-containing protein [Myxococcales bacterium]|nr:VCBS repeat-containing protein [Myxococcales bacterium]